MSGRGRWKKSTRQNREFPDMSELILNFSLQIGFFNCPKLHWTSSDVFRPIYPKWR